MFSIGCVKFVDSYNLLAMPLDQMAKIYGRKTKLLYPYEHFGLDTWGTTTKSYQEVIAILIKKTSNPLYLINYQHKRKSIALIKTTVIKTGKDLTIKYLKNDVELLDYCMNEYVKLSMKQFRLNPLHYVILPGYSFDCWLMSSGVSLDTLQDKQMLDDFVEAKRGGICGIEFDSIVNNSNESKMAKHRRSIGEAVSRRTRGQSGNLLRISGT